MIADMTAHSVLMAGGLTAVTLSILVLTALVLAEAQRRRWCDGRWAAFEREALRSALGPTPPRRGPPLFGRTQA